MKTTVELDEEKLLLVMELTGLKTRKEAIDYALSQAERAAKIAKLFARPRRTKDELKNALNPNYDLTALRGQEKLAVDTVVVTNDPHFSQIPGLKVKRSYL
jgi:Arc/MetJ family transcription regulator